MFFIGLLVLAYLLGSLNSAIVVCKLLGLQSPTTVGSGNPGATNVLRFAGKKVAAITLLGDMLKGIMPIVLGHMLGFSVTWLCWLGLAAVIGHTLPVFFAFKGGKGVAATMGVLLAINIWLGVAVMATWLLIAKGFKISSLAAIVAILLMPIYAYFILGKAVVIVLFILAIVVLLRHHSNIKRLFLGAEKTIK